MPIKGRDYESSVSIALEDARRGTGVNLTLVDEQGERTLQVTIPAGVSQDQKLRLRGKGGKGRQGAPDGDLYLHLNLAPHAVFRPSRHDFYFDLLLTPWEAALGAEIEVPTLDDRIAHLEQQVQSLQALLPRHLSDLYRESRNPQSA